MPDKPKKYKIVMSKDALSDIKSTKKYILDTFKYREYAENFSKKIKKAIKELDSFPKGYESGIIFCQFPPKLHQSYKHRLFHAVYSPGEFII